MKPLSYLTFLILAAIFWLGGLPPSALALTVIAESPNVTVDTRDKVQLSVSALNGTVTGGGLYQPGATATLLATPNPGYVFTGWTGGASGTANPLGILMDSNKTIGATFVADAADNDGDGYSNYDEIRSGSNPNASASIPGDPDGDGFFFASVLEGTGLIDATGGDTMIVNAGGSALASGIAAGGYFTISEAAVAAAVANEDYAALLTSFVPLASDDFVTGMRDVYLGASLPGFYYFLRNLGTQPALLLNRPLYSFIGNGATLAASTEWALVRHSVRITPSNLSRSLFFDPYDEHTLVIGSAGTATYSSAALGVSNVQTATIGLQVVTVLRTLVITATNGTVDAQSAYLDGTTATLLATPNAGYVFTGWAGDTSGSNNPLQLLMNANKAVVANFSPDLADDDGDGLNNYTEVIVYGTDPTKQDSDGDGLTDSWELGVGRFRIEETVAALTWQQARNDARARGGDLASFPTEEMWTLVRTSLGENALDTFLGVWIGASDAAVDGVWQWVNGRPFTFTNWGTGCPSRAQNNVLDYMEISGGEGAEIWKWYDRAETSTRNRYLLEVNYSTNPLVPDEDGDGLNDGQEQTAGTNPFMADTDGDGLTDSEEVNFTKTNPTMVDTDGDGVHDAADDEDGDGLTNLAELRTHLTNPILADSDNDGLTDREEVELTSSNPNLADTDDNGTPDGNEDADSDGLTNLAELRTHLTNPALADSDGDGLSDREEIQQTSTNPNLGDTDADGTLDGEEDADSDGLTNLAELRTHLTNPALADSDGDGLSDREEIQQTSTNPNLGDTDADGTLDGEEDADSDGLTNLAELRTHLTNPALADSDGDGLSDREEIQQTSTNPKLGDTDADGILDGEEDADGDGLTNLAELRTHLTNPALDDSDNDGLKDGAEVSYAGSFYQLVQGSFTYPQAVADATARRGRVASFPDAGEYSRMAAKARQTTQAYLWIGLSDVTTEGAWVWTDDSTATYSQWLAGEPSGGATENRVVIMENSTSWADTVESYPAAGYLFERVGIDPLDPDTDADGLSDGQEITTTLSSPVLDDTDSDGLLDGAEVNTHGSSPLLIDTDADGLNDRVEVEVYQSNPALKDSDGDGFDDAFEVNTGFNPALATSTPDALSSIRTAVEFRFNAANGVSYRIEASTDLDQWDVIEPVIIGQSAVVTRFYSIENQPRRYFRVRRN